MHILATLKMLAFAVLTDRTVHAGGATSTLAFLGPRIDHVQEWLAIGATAFGMLSAAATFLYVCLKIVRMLRNPEAKE